MKLTDLVVSQTLAEQLKAEGYPQQSIYGWADETKVDKSYYFGDNNGYVLVMNIGLINDYNETGYQPIASPTTDELLAVLPKGCYVATRKRGGATASSGNAFPGYPFTERADKPVNVLAMVWLELKASGRLAEHNLLEAV